MFGNDARPARPISLTGHRSSIPASNIPTDLRPWWKTSYEPVYECRTPSGRPALKHLPSKDGECIRCGFYDETADRPIGEGL